jgi:hypothetical protein
LCYGTPDTGVYMNKSDKGVSGLPKLRSLGFRQWTLWWLKFFCKVPVKIYLTTLQETVKALFNNLKRIVVVYIISVSLSTAGFVWTEEVRWIDALYWSVVTSVTVGYGDFSPHNDTGKLVAMGFMFFWFVLAAVFVVNLLTRVIHNPDAWTDSEQRELLASNCRQEAMSILTLQYMELFADRLGVRRLRRPVFNDLGQQVGTSDPYEPWPTDADAAPLVDTPV